MAAPDPASTRPPPPGAARLFLAMLWRDLLMMSRRLPSAVAQTLVQPFFLLLVLGTVLTELGYLRPDHAQVLLPGIVALASFLGAAQATALNMVFEFQITRELDDRLLAPGPTSVVALAKMTFGALRGLLSGLVTLPFGGLLLSVGWEWAALPLLAGLLVLASAAGAAAGMVLGTVVPPDRISVAFAVAVVPMTFTGSTQFPLPLLGDFPAFQVVCALNPLTYASESLRAVTAPTVPHLPLPVSVVVLAACAVLAGWAGVRGFRRRALQ